MRKMERSRVPEMWFCRLLVDFRQRNFFSRSSLFRDVTQRRLVVSDVSGQSIFSIFKGQAVTNVSGQRSFPHLQGSRGYQRLDTTYRFHLKRHTVLDVSGQPVIFNGHEVADVSGQAVGRMFKRRAVQLLDPWCWKPVGWFEKSGTTN
jgi:hypothetical protein